MLRPHTFKKFEAYLKYVPLFILSIGLGLTTYSSVKSYKLAKQSMSDDLVSISQDIEAGTEAHLDHLDTLLLGFAGLFNASERVDADEWELFKRSLSLESRFPEVREVGYVRHSSADSFVVQYGGELLAPGFDLRKNRALLNAATRGRDSGKPQIADEVEGVVGDSAGHYLIVLAPLYKDKEAPEPLAMKRKNFIGFAYAVVDFKILMHKPLQNLESRLTPAIDIEIFSGFEGSQKHILYDHLPSMTLSSEETTLVKDRYVLRKYGYKLIMRFLKPTDYDDEFVLGKLLSTLGFGLFFSILLAALAHTPSRTRLRANQLAQAMLKKANETEKQAESLMKLSPVGIFQADVEGRWTYANDFWKGLANIETSTSNDLKQSWIRNIHPEDREMIASQWSEAIKKKAGFVSEHRYLRKEGSIVWVKTEISPTFNIDGKHTGFLGAVSDITTSREAEEQTALEAEKLRRSQERYELAVKGSNDGIWDWDIKQNEVYFSDRLRDLLGYSAEEFRNSIPDAERFIHPDDKRRVKRAVTRHLVSGGLFSVEFRLLTRHSHYRWFVSRGQAVWDVDGSPLRLSGSLTDIDERRKTEERLWKSNELQKAILNNAAFMIISTDTKGNIKTFNKAAERQLQYNADELVDRRTPSLFLMKSEMEEAAAKIKSDLGIEITADERVLFERARSGQEETREWNFVRRDGSQFPCRLSVSSLRDPDGNLYGFLFTGEDITAQKTAAAAQTRQRQIFEQVVSNAPVAIAMFNTEMKYITHSQKWLEDYGLEGRDIIDRSHYEIFPNIPKNWKDDHRRALQGTPLSKSEDSFEQEDGSRKYLRWAIHPWYRPDGQIGGIIMVTQAVDELVAAREKALEGMNAKSEFLANMSHEIRTPMNGVISMTELLLETSLDPEQQKYAKVIKDSSKNLLSIINDILDFSKVEAGKLRIERHRFSIERCVQNQIELLKPKIVAKGIELSVDLDKETPEYLLGDSSRLGQVLLNLLGNALKFTDRGKISVRSQLVEKSGQRARVRIEVKDSGLGIKKTEAPKLFTPFTQADGTSQRKHGGTGLGLSICKKLCEMMGGEIDFKSRLGKGSTFWFEIPFEVSSDQKSPESDESQENSIQIEDIRKWNRKPRVLIAEDNSVNQIVTKLQLEKFGISASIVSNGREVIEAMEAEPFDIIFMDCQMPEMDGYEATRHVRILEEQSDHKVTIVALTANAMKEDREKCLNSGMDDYLSKPVDIDEMKRVFLEWGGDQVKDQPRKKSEPSSLSDAEEEIVIDSQTFKSLLEIDNDEYELIQDLDRLFRENTQKYFLDMGEGLSTLDSEKVFRAAHTLKSSCAQVGALGLSKICKEIEALAKESKLDSIPELYEAALKLYETAKVQFKKRVQDSLEEKRA